MFGGVLLGVFSTSNKELIGIEVVLLPLDLLFGVITKLVDTVTFVISWRATSAPSSPITIIVDLEVMESVFTFMTDVGDVLLPR
jgi:hypothetical protein